MRLYCPTCRTTYDETSERYDAMGGDIPCRVCRTALALDAPPPDPEAETETEYLAMSQVFTIGEDGKTTMLSAADEDVYGKTTMIDPTKVAGMVDLPSTLSPPGNTYGNSPSNYAPTAMTPSSTGPVPVLSGGNAYQPTVMTPSEPALPTTPAPSYNSTAGGGFHGDPTFIFSPDQPPAQNAGMPVPAAPPRLSPQSTQPQAALPEGAQGDRFKRKVVVGGAFTPDDDPKTQAFDLAAFRQVHLGDDGGAGAEPGPNGMVPLTPQTSSQQMVPVSPPPGAAAPPLAPAQPAPMVMEPVAPTDRHTTVTGVSKAPVIVVGVLFLLTVCFFLMALEILPRPSFVPSLAGDDEEERSPRSDGPEPETPIEGETIDRLLVGLRGFVEPALVSSGEEPSGHAVALGVMPSQTGSVYYWLSTWDTPSQQEISDDFTSAIPQRADRVFVLFDRTTDTGTMVAVLDELREHELSPVLAGGSILGTDRHFAYPAYAPEETEVLVRFDSRSVSVLKTGWPAPQVFCYRSSVPAERVSAAIDDAFLNGSPPYDVHVELAPNLELQLAYNLSQALYRPGLLLYFSQAETMEIPQQCQ